MSAKPIPVILDTDIGNDIDDNWALGLLLKMPELAPKLVLSCTGDTNYRALVAANSSTAQAAPKFRSRSGSPPRNNRLRSLCTSGWAITPPETTPGNFSAETASKKWPGSLRRNRKR